MIYPQYSYTSPQYFPQISQMQNMYTPQQQPVQQQIRSGGIVSVANEDEARRYPVAPGYTVTMRDENGPLTKCITCKGKGFESVNEVIDDDECRALSPSDRFAEVERLENMTAEERFAFWRGELSRCIRCNACRNVCPACTCRACVFDDPKSGVASKANVTDFEENLYHIIRAFHVAGRCTDCGECSRVCPQRIPLHLINRKLIRDMNGLYGEYQAGTGTDERTPLTRYAADDAEPSVVLERGNA